MKNDNEFFFWKFRNGTYLNWIHTDVLGNLKTEFVTNRKQDKTFDIHTKIPSEAYLRDYKIVFDDSSEFSDTEKNFLEGIIKVNEKYATFKEELGEK